MIVRKLQFSAEGGSAKQETDIAEKADEIGLLDTWQRIRDAAR